MKYYIKRTFFTLLEAFFLTGFLFYLEKSVFKNPNRLLPDFFWEAVFVFSLFAIFSLRMLWRRFTLWRVLHFSIRQIDKMTGEEFEEFLKIQFEQLGFLAETTKTSNDYGADLILHKKNLVIAVQAKRYQANIGVKAVQEVIGSMAYYEAQKGLVVTNSVFTKNAEKLASANNVILWDRDVLVRLLSGEPMTGYINELLEL